MAIIKWDPLGNVIALQDRVNELFDDSFPHQVCDGKSFPRCAWTPQVDVYEADQGIVIAADLPGVKREDVQVEVKDNILTLSGERRPDPAIQANHYYRQERTCGSFHRVFTLRTVISPDRITARFKNGVLVVVVPFPEKEESRRIAVEIE